MLPKAERDWVTALSFDLDGKMTADLEAAVKKAGETLSAGTVFLALVRDNYRRQDLAADSVRSFCEQSTVVEREIEVPVARMVASWAK